MAKAKKVKQARKVKKGRKGPRAVGMTNTQKLLVDPCDGPLVSAYGGKRGYITRFVQDFSLNTGAGQTAGVFAFFPGQLVYHTIQVATSGTSAAVSSVLGPGNSFCGTNASNVRCVAACVEVLASAVSLTNITGELGVAQINWNDIGSATTAAPDQYFQLATSRAVLTKEAFELKWVPGESDELYSSVNVGTSASPPGNGVSGMLVVYRGYPAAAALTFRITAVLEWTAKNNVGIPGSTGAAGPSDMQKHVGALNAAKPDWWHNLTNSLAHTGSAFVSGLASDVGKMGRYMAQQGMARLASRAAPLLLGM